MRAWRAKNKVRATLAMLRWRATKKELEFDLTAEWLADFIIRTGYDSSLYHIDRISAGHGYVMDNLQTLPIADNIAKGNRERGAQLQCL